MELFWLDGLINQIAEGFPAQKNTLPLYAGLSIEEKEDVGIILEVLKDKYQLSNEDMLHSYGLMSEDMVEEYRYFVETGAYRCHTFQEADAYMALKAAHYMRYYQIGLLISNLIWPNHIAMRRDFEAAIDGRAGQNYLEIGVGHGYFFARALAQTNFAKYMGVDINADCIEITKAVLAKRTYGAGRDYALVYQDFLQMPEASKFDTIVAGEVLEHIENPLEFLRKIWRLTKESSFVYMTTAINSPAVDHLYLFRNPEEIKDIYAQAGFEIDQMILYPYRNQSVEASLRKKLPITVSIRARRG